jgi:GNAT superfamily N-acetyltransferase
LDKRDSMNLKRLKSLINKANRNVRDYGAAATAGKIANSILAPLYCSRRYLIYRRDLCDLATVLAPRHALKFKILGPQDAGPIRQIEAMEEWLHGKVAHKLTSGCLCMAALDNDMVKGFNIVSFSGFSIPAIRYQRNLREGECFSEQITVRPEFRNKGLGADLRVRVFEELSKRGYRRLYGTTDITNNSNLALSKKVGLLVIARLEYLCRFGKKTFRIARVRP